MPKINLFASATIRRAALTRFDPVQRIPLCEAVRTVMEDLSPEQRTGAVIDSGERTLRFPDVEAIYYGSGFAVVIGC